MSEHKTTPGPWIAEHDIESLASYVVAKSEKESIPYVAMCSYTICGGPATEEQVANANLIATAPDFLTETLTNIDLLKHLLPFFDDAEETTENEVIWTIKEAIERQEKLISKSKGKG